MFACFPSRRSACYLPSSSSPSFTHSSSHVVDFYLRLLLLLLLSVSPWTLIAHLHTRGLARPAVILFQFIPLLLVLSPLHALFSDRPSFSLHLLLVPVPSDPGMLIGHLKPKVCTFVVPVYAANISQSLSQSLPPRLSQIRRMPIHVPLLCQFTPPYTHFRPTPSPPSSLSFVVPSRALVPTQPSSSATFLASCPSIGTLGTISRFRKKTTTRMRYVVLELLPPLKRRSPTLTSGTMVRSFHLSVLEPAVHLMIQGLRAQSAGGSQNDSSATSQPGRPSTAHPELDRGREVVVSDRGDIHAAPPVSQSVGVSRHGGLAPVGQ